MTDKEKIREDVSKLIIPESECNGMSLMEKGRQYAYREVLGIIDSTSEEPVSEGLDDAAFDYAESCKYDGGEKLLCVEHFKAGANWQKKQDQETIELAEDHAMLAGMEKMKEQLMTKSIEAVVSQVPCSNEIILYNPSSVDKYYLPQEMNKLGLNKGDKVKLVIIKED